MRWNGNGKQISWTVIIGIAVCLAIIAIVAWYGIAP
jgi:hypothetical protein